MLTQERLCHLFDYFPDTGVFIRKKQISNCAVGTKAGSINSKGYIVLSIDGKRYYAHRLVWLYVHGYLPEQELDHINRIKNDNRLCNLRLAFRYQNLQNRTAYCNNTTGLKGASFNERKNKYVSQIKINGKTKHIGYFDNAIDAHKAYKEASIKFHTHNIFKKAKEA